jgi:hypothetical protein
MLKETREKEFTRRPAYTERMQMEEAVESSYHTGTGPTAICI